MRSMEVAFPQEAGAVPPFFSPDVRGKKYGCLLYTSKSCVEIERVWQAEREQAPLQEDTAVAVAIENFEALGLEGLMIVTRDGPVAFTMGKRMGPALYDVHFEKADGEIQGAYTIVNREFARWIQARYPQVRYLNPVSYTHLDVYKRQVHALWHGDRVCGLRRHQYR